jgi:putative aldouronate transport system substrate-binding protein
MSRHAAHISLLLAAATVLTMAAGCSGQQKPAASSSAAPISQQTASAPAASSAAEEAGGNPITFPVQEDITFTYWKNIGAAAAKRMTDLGESDTYKEMERITGVKIKFIHPPVNEGSEQFGLMIAAGDWPDIIESAGTYTGGGAKAVEDGVYLDLTELIPQYAPNYTALRAANDDVRKQTMTDDGMMWGMFAIMHQENPTYVGPIVRTDWLDQLGLEMPVTMEDWHTMLTRFKNELGAKTPYVPSTVGNFAGTGYDANGMFVTAYGIGSDFYREDGTVKYGPIQPGFKDYLTEMNRWYSEGLLDPEFPAKTDLDAILAALSSGDAGATMMDPGTLDPVWRVNNIPYDNAYYPVLEKGQQTHFRQTEGMVTSGWVAAVSTKNKHPEIAVAWLDYAYGDEGMKIFNYGIEGKSYVMENGKPVFTDTMLKNPDVPVNDGMWMFKMHEAPMLRDGAYSNPASYGMIQNLEIKTRWTTMDNSFNLPILSQTAEEGKKISALMSEIDTYRNEKVIKFIMGIEPLDGFDAYVDTLRQMGIEEVIGIKQAALDRYNAK